MKATQRRFAALQAGPPNFTIAMWKKTKRPTETDKPAKEQNKLAEEIEAAFERFYRGKTAYSKGQFHGNEFFLRTDYVLVVLDKNNDIRVSFADHTRPSYAALFTLLLGEIEAAGLIICEDYETDENGSMLCREGDHGSTGAIIWDEKERYYAMLKEKVSKGVIHKGKKHIEE